METNKKIVAVSVALMLTTIFSLVAPVIAGKPFFEEVYVNGNTVWMNAIGMPHETPDPSHADFYAFPSAFPTPGPPPPVYQLSVIDSEPGDSWYSPLWNVEIIFIFDLDLDGNSPLGNDVFDQDDYDIVVGLNGGPLTSSEQVHAWEGILYIIVETGDVFLCAVVNENAR